MTLILTHRETEHLIIIVVLEALICDETACIRLLRGGLYVD